MVLEERAPLPKASLNQPVVLEERALLPTAVLFNVDVPARISSETLPITSRNVMMAEEVAELVMSKRETGVEVPIPTFPFCNIVKSEEPVLDAILNGLVPAVPCTLNV